VPLSTWRVGASRLAALASEQLYVANLQCCPHGKLRGKPRCPADQQLAQPGSSQTVGFDPQGPVPVAGSLRQLNYIRFGSFLQSHGSFALQYQLRRQESENPTPIGP